MTLTRRERDELHAAQLKVRQFKARERKDAKAKHPKSPKADRGRVRDNGYLAWLRRQPCAVGPLGCEGPTEAAHVRYSRPGEPNPGLQVKPSDKYAVPLCSGHHRTGPEAQHAAGERAWWASRGIDPFELAARLYAEYQSDKP
jgi:hypothetical protein